MQIVKTWVAETDIVNEYGRLVLSVDCQHMNASPDSVGCFSTFFKEPPVDKQFAPGGKSENPTRNGRFTARNPSGWPRPVRQFRFPAGSGQIDPSRTRSCNFWQFPGCQSCSNRC